MLMDVNRNKCRRFFSGFICYRLEEFWNRWDVKYIQEKCLLVERLYVAPWKILHHWALGSVVAFAFRILVLLDLKVVKRAKGVGGVLYCKGRKSCGYQADHLALADVLMFCWSRVLNL